MLVRFANGRYIQHVEQQVNATIYEKMDYLSVTHRLLLILDVSAVESKGRTILYRRYGVTQERDGR